MAGIKLVELQERLGLQFNDPQLLKLAMTHRSYVNEKASASESNERLEYLGDSVLGLSAATFLYQALPGHSEGDLTDIRAELVRRETLNQWANSFRLGYYMLLGRGEATTGGRNRPRSLAGAFEAVLGALYLDKGLAAVQEWLNPLLEKELTVIMAEERHKNYKSQLLTQAQRLYHRIPHYSVVTTNGPKHSPIFEVEAVLDSRVIGRGSGATKLLAQQSAAKAALATLATDLPTITTDSSPDA